MLVLKLSEFLQQFGTPSNVTAPQIFMLIMLYVCVDCMVSRADDYMMLRLLFCSDKHHLSRFLIQTLQTYIFISNESQPAWIWLSVP